MAAPTNASKHCLLVVSAAHQGVSAQSFVQTYTILHQAQLHIQLASPGGKPCQLVNQDDTNRKWIADFRSKSYSHPISLDSVDASRYSAIVIPHSPGAINDLAKNPHLSDILNSFLNENKLVCAVGQGGAGLCCARGEDKKWIFKGKCLTALSLYEVARQADFPTMNLIVEDFMKDNGAVFSASQANSLHVVIDGNVITGQNEASTLTAVQNLVLLATQTSRGRTSHR